MKKKKTKKNGSSCGYKWRINADGSVTILKKPYHKGDHYAVNKK